VAQDHLLGVVSDTHGLLRPEVVRALAGVDRILHPRDVGHPDVLTQLERLAPVVAVRGNVDHGAWAARLPETAEVEVAGRWLHVLHDLADLALDPRAAGFDVVVFGHSHQPVVERREGVLYLNPGSAGRRRFRLPVGVARLHVSTAGVDAELVTLDV
jgi:putative phosphoesterase